jgi:translocation and assembly module TamA
MALFAASAAAAHPQIELKGVSGPLADNIELYLDRLPSKNNLGSRRFQNKVLEDVKLAGRAVGYYRMVIEPSLVGKDKKQKLRLTITPGEALRLKSVKVEVLGEASTDPEFAKLLKQIGPKVNHRVHHGRYEEIKNQLNSLALRRGYFQAKFVKQELSVAPRLLQGFIHIQFDSGPRYHFGTVEFEGSQIRDERLRSMLPFQPGDPYQSSQLGELNQHLAETNWFRSIDVTVDDPENAEQQLAVKIKVEPQIRNTVETGIGYSTDLGPRIKLNWSKPWLNDRGHSLNSKMALSGPEQTVEAGYKWPKTDVNDDYYKLSLGIKNKDLEDTRSQEYNTALERYWLLDNGWYRTASLRWLYEDYVQGEDSGSANLIMPGINFSRSSDSGGSMPAEASRYSVGAEVSEPAWGSDSSFVRLRGRVGWIGSFSDDQRWLARFDVGAVLMESVTDLPPSLRFFAGGDNSIRGYSYESISPVAEDGTLTGARYLATSALEYQHRVSGNWWAAAFVDAGSAWNDKADIYKGVGLGVRWASPVGPIRIDVAWGLDVASKDALQLHFSLGPEL